MSSDSRGFEFELRAPQLQVQWQLEAALAKLSAAKRELSDSVAMLAELTEKQAAFTQACTAKPGAVIDVTHHARQLAYMETLGRQIDAADETRRERMKRHRAALDLCMSLRKRGDNLDDMQRQALSAFSSERTRRDLARLDDEWVLRTGVRHRLAQALARHTRTEAGI